MTSKNLFICPGPAPGPPTPGSLPRRPPPPVKTVVPLGQVPTECLLHTPRQHTRGYALHLGRPPLDGLWGLQDRSLVPVSLSVGPRAGCSAFRGEPGPALLLQTPHRSAWGGVHQQAPGIEGQGLSFLLVNNT